MSKLRNLLVIGAALGLSCAVYATDEQKAATPEGSRGYLTHVTAG